MEIDIRGLNQAEDRDIEFHVTVDSLPLNNVQSSFMEIRNLRKELIKKIEMIGGGVIFSNSILTVRLTDTDTLALAEEYNYELWIQDTNSRKTKVAHGKINFNKTFGRF